MSTKHTPGPWQIARYNDDTSMCEIETVARGVDVPDQGYTIASVYAGAYDAGPDARLIAAAPDLLAACDLSLRNVLSLAYLLPVDADETTRASYRVWQETLSEAIAKAAH